MQDVAERAQAKRDLKAQLGGLDRQDEQEIVFKETSPARRMYTIYSMVDGSPISIPYSLLERTLDKTLENGSFMFTAKQSEAPEFKLGQVKCFLHPESPDRAILQDIGLGSTICNAGHLSNSHSKRIHAQHRHSQEWAAYQEYLTEQRENATIDRQERQLEATLALAGKASASEPQLVVTVPTKDAPEPLTCLSCGETIEGKLKDHTCK